MISLSQIIVIIRGLSQAQYLANTRYHITASTFFMRIIPSKRKTLILYTMFSLPINTNVTNAVSRISTGRWVGFDALAFVPTAVVVVTTFFAAVE